MTRLETYNNLIAEVERDTALVGLPALEGSLYENLESEGIRLSLPDTLEMETPLSAFSDYAIRDAVMTKACEDEQFSFVLVNKITRSVYPRKDSPSEITQDDLEALAVSSHVGTMWEQFDPAVSILSWTQQLVEEERPDLKVPSLMDITVRLIQAREVFDFAGTRKQMPIDMKESLLQQLQD